MKWPLPIFVITLEGKGVPVMFWFDQQLTLDHVNSREYDLKIKVGKHMGIVTSKVDIISLLLDRLAA